MTITYLWHNASRARFNPILSPYAPSGTSPQPWCATRLLKKPSDGAGPTGLLLPAQKGQPTHTLLSTSEERNSREVQGHTCPRHATPEVVPDRIRNDTCQRREVYPHTQNKLQNNEHHNVPHLYTTAFASPAAGRISDSRSAITAGLHCPPPRAVAEPNSWLLHRSRYRPPPLAGISAHCCCCCSPSCGCTALQAARHRRPPNPPDPVGVQHTPQSSLRVSAFPVRPTDNPPPLCQVDAHFLPTTPSPPPRPPPKRSPESLSNHESHPNLQPLRPPSHCRTRPRRTLRPTAARRPHELVADTGRQ